MPPHDDTSWVRCYGCGAETGWRPTGDEAAAAWNIRADLHDATKAQLAKAVEALRFYADSHEIPSEGPWGLHSNDFGSKARTVLADIEKGGV